MKLGIVAVCAALVFSVAAPALAGEKNIYAAAVADPMRPKKDTDRDALRLPRETLAFAEVRPGMIVGELFPGGGYFTRPLSIIVGAKGKVYATEDAAWIDVAKEKKVFADAHMTNVMVAAKPFGEINAPEKLDLFFIAQNYHDLHIAEYGKVDLAAFNKRVFAALKPGGTYFILDHQANKGTTEAQIAKMHRIEKAQVIREVEAAGFKFESEGTFLHRAADDHKKPIFDDTIKGKTDQYALKFRRP